MLSNANLSALLWRTGSALALVLIALLALLPAWIALAQENESADDDSSPAESAQIAATEMPLPPLDPESIVVLELGSYETGWLRFYNSGPDGIRYLEIEGETELPFRAFVVPDLLRLEDMRDPAFLRALIIVGGMEYDADEMQGVCDTHRLAQYRTTDIYCEPGSSIMEPGLVIVVLYHPQTRAILALTTAIDNRGGVATNADDWVVLPAATPTPESVAPQSGSCGPYAHGQWISADDYRKSGLTLPINEDDLVGIANVYQCVASGQAQGYLRALRDWGLEPPKESTGGQQTGASDGGDDGDDDDDDDDNGGVCDPRTGCNPCPTNMCPIIDYQTGEYTCGDSC